MVFLVLSGRFGRSFFFVVISARYLPLRFGFLDSRYDEQSRAELDLDMETEVRSKRQMHVSV